MRLFRLSETRPQGPHCYEKELRIDKSSTKKIKSHKKSCVSFCTNDKIYGQTAISFVCKGLKSLKASNLTKIEENKIQAFNGG